jgi:hypothetical protein
MHMALPDPRFATVSGYVLTIFVTSVWTNFVSPAQNRVGPTKNVMRQ